MGLQDSENTMYICNKSIGCMRRPCNVHGICCSWLLPSGGEIWTDNSSLPSPREVTYEQEPTLLFLGVAFLHWHFLNGSRAWDANLSEADQAILVDEVASHFALYHVVEFRVKQRSQNFAFPLHLAQCQWHKMRLKWGIRGFLAKPLNVIFQSITFKLAYSFRAFGPGQNWTDKWVILSSIHCIT